MNANLYTVNQIIMVIEVILRFLEGPEDSIKADLWKQSFDQTSVCNWAEF